MQLVIFVNQNIVLQQLVFGHKIFVEWKMR